MGLIICYACDRQREIKPIKRIKYVCSNCGAHNPIKIMRRKIWMDWSENQGKIKDEALRVTYARLKYWAENRNYKPGWVSVKFKMIFGYWPPDAIIDGIEPIAPNEGLMRWIAKSNEAWRRQKRLEEKLQQPVVLELRLEEQSPLMTEDDIAAFTGDWG